MTTIMATLYDILALAFAKRDIGPSYMGEVSPITSYPSLNGAAVGITLIVFSNIDFAVRHACKTIHTGQQLVPLN